MVEKTLLDEFAMAALTGLVSLEDPVGRSKVIVVEEAYTYARLMLEERECVPNKDIGASARMAR